MTDSVFAPAALMALAAVSALAALAGAGSAHAQPSPITVPATQRSAAAQGPRNGDYIAVIVNQELVTAGEVERRLQRTVADTPRGTALPPEPELRRQLLDVLIDERVMVSSARDSGMRVDEPEIDRAVQSIAQQNQVTIAQLRDRLRTEGTDYGRFRANVREQIMVERLREREVYRRITITDEEIDKQLAQQRAAAGADAETNIAQILVTVAEGASEAVVAERRARALAALERVRNGEAFEAVAREVSEDSNRAAGGVIGSRPASRLPDVFVEATRNLKPGEVTTEPLRTGAGFHVLKLLERKDGGAGQITQTRARHVLLRTSPQLSTEVAMRRLAEYRTQIEAKRSSFEDIARQYSEDGSAAQGGELGWTNPGVMVPEFETAMNELPAGGISAPVVSRFGVHLIQVLERREQAVDPKQQREQARGVLREQRFEQAYLDWAKELRARAYVEYREPPQ